MNVRTVARNPLLDLSLTQVAELVKSKQVSPVELTDASLGRIDDLNPRLRAFISVYESAREVAKGAEIMMMAGHSLGPLHGIPLALKDNIALKGLRTTAGSKILSDWLPDADATVAARLRSAGSVFVGKCNMHEFAWGGTSDNPHYGAVRNPWNTDRFPAGSSGGSGAAVAARMCWGALGTDTGGSIRLPSAINGIVGIRPTYGRVSNKGIIPLAWSMDTAGPMARTVEDCALLFSAIAGHDPRDATTASVPVSDYLGKLGRGARGLRVGVVPDYFFRHLQKPVHDAVKSALKMFEEMGAHVVDVGIENIHGNISAQLTIESCEPSTYHQRWLRERPDDYGDDVRTLLEVGEMLLATHYLQAQRYRTLLRQEFLEAFAHVDLFLCPTLPFTATRVGEMKVVIEDGVEEDMLSAIMQFTGVPSLTGLPSLAVPCGFDADGLPIGMQLIGKPFDEATLFQAGAAFQSASDFHLHSPQL
ncbi:aspartyl-tRNA(Asn)/glutamyl-tRNA(Gln) amidotransferase subunit A [Variovorax boronicumulans]|uniref:amidase n=1 Tax=Variovorax boronicumulans TaxID=436515 RepID=UPI0027882855|nr:amidase [Variovorax boronicumulans]MDP9995706.1 aspartyl-tRNA(Asn)/glutamyl-tRNA(Gln) amidotransferase subunit A [Variovorax boronicumulans]MDQ0006829.1 aspartyl-tRNA(Asn)/glutamyl-tRNA(Gln) amidotransferase subunit A [Variovorax boronicumulans]